MNIFYLLFYQSKLKIQVLSYYIPYPTGHFKKTTDSICKLWLQLNFAVFPKNENNEIEISYYDGLSSIGVMCLPLNQRFTGSNLA